MNKYQQMQVKENNQMSEQIELPESPDLYKGARNKFIIKVYTILTLQLLITTTLVIFTMVFESFAKFQSNYFIFTILAWIIAVVLLMAFAIKRQLSQGYPINMIMLIVFTLAQSYIVSSVCSLYEPASVFLAAGVTAFASIGITLYAIFTKSQFTSYWQGLSGKFRDNIAIGWSFFMSIVFLSLVNFWFINIPLFSSLIALVFAVIFSVYLVIDTQLIIGKNKHNISLDNYVLGAIFLYLDIIGLFMEILRIVGKLRNN